MTRAVISQEQSKSPFSTFQAIMEASIDIRKRAKTPRETRASSNHFKGIATELLDTINKHKAAWSNLPYAQTQRPEVRFQYSTVIQAHLNLTLFDSLAMYFSNASCLMSFLQQDKTHLAAIIKLIQHFSQTSSELIHQVDYFLLDRNAYIFNTTPPTYKASEMRNKIPKLAEYLCQNIKTFSEKLLNFTSESTKAIISEYNLTARLDAHTSLRQKKLTLNKSTQKKLTAAIEQNIASKYCSIKLLEQLFILHNIASNQAFEYAHSDRAYLYKQATQLLEDAHLFKRVFSIASSQFEKTRRQIISNNINQIIKRLQNLRPGTSGLTANPHRLYAKPSIKRSRHTAPERDETKPVDEAIEALLPAVPFRV